MPGVARPAPGLQLVDQASQAVFDVITLSRPSAAMANENREGPDDEFNANFGRAVRC